MILTDLRLRINPLSLETNEKFENSTEKYTYQQTSSADNSSKTGAGTLATLHQNDPESLLYNFGNKSYAVECPSGYFLEQFIKKFPFLNFKRPKIAYEVGQNPMT